MFIPLAQLLVTGRADDHPVAIRQGELCCFAQLRGDVDLNLRRIKALCQDKPAGSRHVLLFAEDSYLFSVGMLAILHAGLEVVLPENGQPGTLEKYRQNSLILLTDTGSGDEGSSLVIATGRADSGITHQPFTAVSGTISFFTSGSTGTPKKIPKSLRGLDREAALLERQWGETLAGASVLSTVTHQHLYGLTFKIYWSLCAGRPFVAETFAYWEPLIALLQELPQRSGCVVASPAHLTRYPPLAVLTPSQQPQQIFSAGAALPVSSINSSISVLGRVPTEVFGSTETGVVAWREQCPEDNAWTLFNDIDGRVGLAGNLVIDSPLVDGDGWFETSDLVELCDDGRFLLNGRVDRIVKIEGKRVSLTAIEQFLAALEWIDEAATLVLADGPPSLAGVVVLTAAGDAKRCEYGDFRFGRLLREQMRKFFDQTELPKRWRFVAQIPVNPQGKRIQQTLLELFNE